MKPLHASFKRLRRCPCCQSTYSKKNSGAAKNHGKTAARRRAKNELQREVRSCP